MLILETVKCTGNIWMDILYLVIGLVVGVLAGFFISKKLVSKQLKENPPVSEEMIKTLMRGMGRNPSQTTYETNAKVPIGTFFVI